MDFSCSRNHSHWTRAPNSYQLEKYKKKKNASIWINSWLTCKFLCSELVTFNLTCWSPLRLPHFIVLASNITSPFWVDFLLSVCPQELGIHDKTNVVFSGDLFPDLSQTHAWMGEVRKQFEKNLAACSFLSDASSNAWLFNSMWCGAPGGNRIDRKMVISLLGLTTECRATFERLSVSSGSSARQSIPRYMI